MIGWLTSNLLTVIVIAVLLLIIAAAVAVLIVENKKGSASCGGKCSGCPYCNNCPTGKR
ncbi:MAG: FeoB-associated Cys-rich membrane protein [Clostridia bacterium]|nr:FeoB-associated Cys-rich membrane protein [Clostridia bacterium]